MHCLPLLSGIPDKSGYQEFRVIEKGAGKHLSSTFLLLFFLITFLFIHVESRISPKWTLYRIPDNSGESVQFLNQIIIHDDKSFDSVLGFEDTVRRGSLLDCFSFLLRVRESIY